MSESHVIEAQPVSLELRPCFEARWSYKELIYRTLALGVGFVRAPGLVTVSYYSLSSPA